MQGVVTVTVDPSLDTTAVADRVEANRKIRCIEARHDPGGGGINVARAIHAFGGRATAVWTMGGDFGAVIKDLLDSEGIDHASIEIEGDTRQSFAVIEKSSDRHYRFSTPGPDVSSVELDRIVAEVKRRSPKLLAISGTSQPTIPTGFYAKLAEVGAAVGARVIVDTHGEPLRAALEGGNVFLIKPNYRELMDTARVASGRQEPNVVEVAQDLLAETHVGAVVVSLGAGGAVLVTSGQVVRIPAPTVPIRSRIGAGDSLVGGLAWRLACGDDLTGAVRYGVAAGAAAVMTPGTELCRVEDVEQLFAHM